MHPKVKSVIIQISIVLIAAGIIVALNHYVFQIKPRQIKEWVDQFGFWAPFIFLLIFAVRPFTLVPLSIIAISCGIMFGSISGTIYIILGTTLGAFTSFIAMKYFFKELHMKEEGQENLKALKNDLEEHGFKSVLFIRLIPGLNFDFITYICAKTKVNLLKFLLATFVGTIPGSMMFSFFGSSLLSLELENLIVLGIILLVMVSLGLFIKKSVGKKYDVDQLKSEIKDLKQSS